MSPHKRTLLRLLSRALDEIQMELDAAGADEVRGNPILRGKQQFVDRTRRRIAGWEKALRDT